MDIEELEYEGSDSEEEGANPDVKMNEYLDGK